jgi:tRNA (guanosine-2'-O-)-methyltransferase
MNELERLYSLLSEHLTDRKKKRFEEVAALRTRFITLVLEDVYQTQNASAIFRSMEAWGVQDAYIIENQHSLNNHPRISKGASEWLTFHRFHEHSNNTKACIQALRNKGYRIVATAFDPSAVPLESLPMDVPTAVVMGTELTGISAEMEAACDAKVIIPMHGFTESLNVSVAAAVILQHLACLVRKGEAAWQLTPEEQLKLKIEWARKSIYWSQHIVDLFEAGELKSR